MTDFKEGASGDNPFGSGADDNEDNEDDVDALNELARLKADQRIVGAAIINRKTIIR